MTCAACPSGRRRGQAERLAGKRVGDDLLEAEADSEVAEAFAQVFDGTWFNRRKAATQHGRRQIFIAVDAAELFNHVVRELDVGPPSGWLDGVRAGVQSTAKAQAVEDAQGVVRRHGDAKHLFDAGLRESDGALWLRARVGIDEALGDDAAGELFEEMQGAMLDKLDDARADAFFEPKGRLGAQLQLPRCAPDGATSEVGDFEEDGGRLGRRLRFRRRP